MDVVERIERVQAQVQSPVYLNYDQFNHSHLNIPVVIWRPTRLGAWKNKEIYVVVGFSRKDYKKS